MPTTRRTLTLALLLVAAATALTFATGATVVNNADTVADGDLAIQPADGPNGQYAYLNDDDEITIDISASNPNLPPDFEGVTPDSLATADGVFTITYTGDRYAHVWVDNEGENVTFLARGESFEGEPNNVTLAPNQTVAVGLDIDARGTAAGTRLGADEFRINASIAGPDDVTDPGVSTQQTGSGGPTTTVTAPSADRREFVASGIGRGDTVRFLLDGMSLDGDDVTLNGIDLQGVRNERVELDAAGNPAPFENASALTAPATPRPVAYLALEHDFATDDVDAMTVRFSVDADHLNATGTDPEDVTLYRQTDAGEWEEKPVEVVDEEVVRVTGLPEDRVHFRATTEEFSTFAVAERVPRFDVTEAAVAPEAIEPGETATVTATLRNGGGADGERTITLTADGGPVANETVALAPNETATVALGGALETAGAYDLAVDGTPVDTLVVGDPGGDGAGGSAAAEGPGDGADDDPTEEPSGIDLAQLGGLLAAFVVAVAGLALYRRMPRS